MDLFAPFAEGIENLVDVYNILMKTNDMCCGTSAIIGISVIVVVILFIRKRNRVNKK